MKPRNRYSLQRLHALIVLWPGNIEFSPHREIERKDTTGDVGGEEETENADGRLRDTPFFGQ